MAVPKRRTSRSNTRHRRSRWKASAPDLVPITVNGRQLLVPRRLVRDYRRGLITVERSHSVTGQPFSVSSRRSH